MRGGMARRIDADGHVLEPPDTWARYLDPRWRARAIRVARQPDGRDALLIDGRVAALTTPAMLGGFGGMGRTIEELAAAALSGRYAENAPAAATDPRKRTAVGRRPPSNEIAYVSHRGHCIRRAGRRRRAVCWGLLAAPAVDHSQLRRLRSLHSLFADSGRTATSA